MKKKFQKLTSKKNKKKQEKTRKNKKKQAKSKETDSVCEKNKFHLQTHRYTDTQMDRQTH